MKNVRRFSFIAAAAMLVVALSGCETVQHADRTDSKADQRASMIDHKMNDQLRDARPDADIVQYLDHQYVSLEPVEREVQPVAGIKKSLNCHIQIATEQPISILEAAQIITRECHVPVRVTQDAMQQIANPAGSLAQLQGQGGGTMPMAGGTAPVVGAIGGAPNYASQMARYGGGAGFDNSLIDVNYDGEGDGFLDMLTARMGGLSWRQDDSGVIRIYAVDTRTFSIASIATDTQLDSNFQSGTTMVAGATSGGTGGSGGSSGGGQSGSGQGTSTTMQSTAIKMKTDLWKDIQNTLDTMAGKGNAVVAPSMGSVTVRANVDVLDQVKKYIDYQNKRLSKFVQFNVKVYSVTLSNNDSAGVNWNALYQTVTGKYGIKLSGAAFTAPAAAVSAGFSVLKSSGSPWSGTEAVVSALNEQGKANLERSQALPTLNFQAVATQVGTQTGYVAGTQTTQTAQVGSSTSIQMGTINVGFNLSLFPYVQDNNDILVQFNLNLSNLDSIRTVKVGDSSAEAPNINLPLNTVQKVRVRPGDTLMLTGINQNDDSSNRTGTGMHWNWALGGGVNAQSNRTMLVVLITPIMLD
ncbi:PilN family type IVB pilus formation outer membrane protein [Burkholderia arboris]|uniref:PilN family type IVB pilus formation outer membrane protein n=1 Tax=Burkholderia arboris TaxID=488730 RepID=UPI001CF27477|nr:PilN family type IVB pilus formation outer membrane protein [Burkholderia arboris]MCA8050681.1 PilN family type IVB pilus formation outer membrane protein [Burkholderia arboris]